MTALEKQFQEDMIDIYDTAQAEFDYRATRLLRLVSTFGGVQAARQLIDPNVDTYGREVLLENERLELSIEALVLREEYRGLFTDEERQVCREILEELGFDAGGART
jgi:hypothetical protein